MAKFYVTTPIYYVNDVPHIGHAYTTIAADVTARYHRLMGDDTFFLTGTDEHGQNIERIAEEKGVSPQQYCDQIVARFKELWQMLDISNDYFIRTTDERHVTAVQAFARALLSSGDVYEGTYAGWYCPRCEAFYQPEELIEEHQCPVHKRAAEWTEEANYFFALSKYQDRLQHLIAETDFAQPDIRRNELLGVLRQGLQDFSISRERVRWGVPLPDDPGRHEPPARETLLHPKARFQVLHLAPGPESIHQAFPVRGVFPDVDLQRRPSQDLVPGPPGDVREPLVHIDVNPVP